MTKSNFVWHTHTHSANHSSWASFKWRCLLPRFSLLCKDSSLIQRISVYLHPSSFTHTIIIIVRTHDVCVCVIGWSLCFNACCSCIDGVLYPILGIHVYGGISAERHISNHGFRDHIPSHQHHIWHRIVWSSPRFRICSRWCHLFPPNPFSRYCCHIFAIFIHISLYCRIHHSLNAPDLSILVVSNQTSLTHPSRDHLCDDYSLDSRHHPHLDPQCLSLDQTWSHEYECVYSGKLWQHWYNRRIYSRFVEARKSLIKHGLRMASVIPSWCL